MKLVQHQPLRLAVARLLVGAGASEADARTVADHLVDSNLSGHDSHGVGMLPHYVRAIAAGLLDPKAQASVEDAGGAILSVDGQNGFGQVVAKVGTALGMARAKTMGIAMVALRGAFHIGRIGTYAEQAAAQGIASIHFVNVVGHAPMVAPFRGSDARFATNPFCVAVPAAGDHPAVVLDFATSLVALGKVRVALNKGETLPEGTLIDSTGQGTTDPAVMYTDPRGAILPFGLHKGYGLAFLCELLAGAFTGGGTVSTVPYEKDRITNNMLSIFIDPAQLPGAAGLEAQVAAAIEHVKASPPADPDLPVLVAGEPELAHRAQRKAEGIPIDSTTWEQLIEAGKAVGMDFTL